MKKLISIILFLIVLAACSTSRKSLNPSVYNSLVGQNELAILKEIGPPTHIEHTRDGGKVMIYEYSEKGMFLTPKQPKFKYDASTKELSYTSKASRVTNDPQYMIYQNNESKLKAYINKKGTCYRVDGSLPQEYMETRYERFKHFK